MATMEPSEYLRQVPLFAHLSEANLRRVADLARRELFPRHSVLAQVGQPGQAFYYILAGEAVVHIGGARGQPPRPVDYLKPGDSFGVTSLILGEPHDASVRATTDLLALVLYKEDMDRLRHQVPGLMDQLALPEAIRAKLRHRRFPWLDAGEVVVFVGQRHWFVFAQAMILPTLGALALGGLLPWLLRSVEWPWWVASVVALLLYAGAFVYRWIDWRNDYFIVTTRRVVHREMIVLQYESRREAPLNQIQDVTVKRDSWGNLLGFGDVHIATAAPGKAGVILFDHLPDPQVAKDIIFQQVYREQARSRMAAREDLRRELKRQLGWLTPEELLAQGEARAIPPRQPARPPARRLRLPSLGLIRPLPPVREQVGNRITWRKHRIFLLGRIARPVLVGLGLLTLFLAYLFDLLPFESGGPSLGGILGLIVLSLPIGFWLWWEVTDWGNDVYILTDDRLIDIEKRPLFGKEERREASLDRVQDANLVVPGFWATVLNYGNVDIETAGAEGQFTFTHVAAPRDVQRDVMNRVAQYRERRRQMESLQRRRELTDSLAAYESLRREKERLRHPPPAPPAGASEG